jgi:ABC-type glycerol-3-phosphate transport system permease component
MAAVPRPLAIPKSTVHPRSRPVRVSTLLAYGVVIVASILSAFPIYWMVATSLKTRWDSFRLPPKWIFVPTFENYVSVFTGTGWNATPMAQLLKHSAIVSIGSTIVALIAGAMTAYALARFPHTPGTRRFAGWILSTRVLPPVVVALPVFGMMQALGLVDTYPGLIIPYAAFNLPFVVWMLKGFFEGVPEDLEHSAMVDGATRWQAFWQIALPLVAPGVAATAILIWAVSWNEFLFALLLTRSLKTAPVAVTEFVTMYGIEWGQLTATASMMALPPLILTMLVQKHLVKGLTFGAIK